MDPSEEGPCGILEIVWQRRNFSVQMLHKVNDRDAGEGDGDTDRAQCP